MNLEPQQLPSAYSDSAFRGRVYGVTGSAHGIGEATVKQLARLGASVVVIDLDPHHLKRVEADLKNAGASAMCLRGDVADETLIKNAIRAARKRWDRIDGWVNNAAFNPGGRPDDLPARDFDRAWRVNVVAAWAAIGALIPIMEKQGGGSIVSLSSIMAHLPSSGNAAYCLTKSAVEGMTRSLAVDLAPLRIRVNAVIPGSIYTHYEKDHFDPPPLRGISAAAMKKSRELRRRLREHQWRSGQPWPLRGEARDAADVILFLLSDAARFVSGACIPVDGAAGVYRPYLWQLNLKDIARDLRAHRDFLKKHPRLRMRHLLRKHKKLLRGKR